MGRIRTYNPKQVIVTLGGHIVSGYAEDSFVSIEGNGDGITRKVGCNGEIVRSVSPDRTFNVKISLLQTSETNSWLQNMQSLDIDTGEGMFSIEVKDLRGGTLFFAADAWIVKPAARGYGRESSNREWDIQTGDGEIVED